MGFKNKEQQAAVMAQYNNDPSRTSIRGKIVSKRKQKHRMDRKLVRAQTKVPYGQILNIETPGGMVKVNPQDKRYDHFYKVYIGKKPEITDSDSQTAHDLKPGTKVLYDAYPHGKDIPGVLDSKGVIQSTGKEKKDFEKHGMSSSIRVADAQNIRKAVPLKSKKCVGGFVDRTLKHHIKKINLDVVHGEINEIYSKWDEGKITKAQAKEKMTRLFIKKNQAFKKEKEVKLPRLTDKRKDQLYMAKNLIVTEKMNKRETIKELNRFYDKDSPKKLEKLYKEARFRIQKGEGVGTDNFLNPSQLK